jgi:hypothetical protein
MGVGKILSGGYGCGWVIPNGFVPIAISSSVGPGFLSTTRAVASPICVCFFPGVVRVAY